jgi:glycosyltransferase involved in cell wall biosynthesis
MKLVMTMVVRDEGDVLDAQLAFHLDQDVDLVLVTDNGSTDGTPEILDRYAREGHVHVLHEPSEEFLQSEWVTRMARLAATDFGADWVLNTDADEFWWPRHGSFKEILREVPRRFGILRGFQRHFVTRPDDDRHFAERMIVRVRPDGARTERGDPFQGAMAVVHRADPGVALMHGSHDVTSPGLVTLRGWYPFEVLHFPLRSLEQSRRKFEHKREALRRGHAELGLHTLAAIRALEAGRYDDWYASYVVDDAAVADNAVSYVIDTRQRDVLRRLVRADRIPSSPDFPLPGDAPRVPLPRPTLADEASYADEMQVHHRFDSQVMAVSRIRGLEHRFDALEAAYGTLRRRLRPRRFTRSAG